MSGPLPTRYWVVAYPSGTSHLGRAVNCCTHLDDAERAIAWREEHEPKNGPYKLFDVREIDRAASECREEGE